jgi:hypothetical protein
MRFRLSLVVVSVTSSFLVGMPNAWAMGKKPTTPVGAGCNANGDTGLTTPNPSRKVVVNKVTTLPFNLPNGTRVDLSADLDTIIRTSITATQQYLPTDGGAADNCGDHLEIYGAVTTLELNAVQFGISFGYSPSGENNTVTNLTGSADVNVGNISMDFGVRECNGGGCSTVGAVSASALTAGVNLSFKIDFSQVQLGPDLVAKTDLGKILRGIMDDGMKRLAKSANPSTLSWSSTVREVDSDGSFIFDAGQNAMLGINQAFAVYAVTPATGACNVYKAVANVHTRQVEPLSSIAVVDQSLDPRGVQVGDRVVVRAVGSGH